MGAKDSDKREAFKALVSLKPNKKSCGDCKKLNGLDWCSFHRRFVKSHNQKLIMAYKCEKFEKCDN